MKLSCQMWGFTLHWPVLFAHSGATQGCLLREGSVLGNDCPGSEGPVGDFLVIHRVHQSIVGRSPSVTGLPQGQKGLSLWLRRILYSQGPCIWEGFP